MASLVDQLEGQDTADLNGQLAQAAHDRTWANTFSSTPPTEVLRANRNYEDLLSSAADRQLEMRAQHDPVAQKQFYESRMQPLKEELARGQIEHEAASTLAAGATTRFHQQQDTDTMSHVVGFADYMTKAPQPGTQEYKAYVLKGVQQFPRMATTAWGKETLGNLAKENDTIESLQSRIPGGFTMKGGTIGKDQHINFESGSGNDLAKELKDGYGLTPGQIKSPVAVRVGKLDGEKFTGDNGGNVVEITTGKKGEKVHMSVPEYQRFGGAFSKETEAARQPAAPAASPSATPKHLGTYNPKTGNFE